MIFAARWTGWLDWIDARDRGLLDRCLIDSECAVLVRHLWIGITQGGSAVATIGAVLLPLCSSRWPRGASMRAGVALATSHLAVQCIKRFVHRERPVHAAVIRCPDRFSFPSGHAAASLAVALTFALAFPVLAVPLIALGVTIGWSRVVLGVHYPADVLAGEALAVVAVVVVAGS